MAGLPVYFGNIAFGTITLVKIALCQYYKQKADSVKEDMQLI